MQRRDMKINLQLALALRLRLRLQLWLFTLVSGFSTNKRAVQRWATRMTGKD